MLKAFLAAAVALPAMAIAQTPAAAPAATPAADWPTWGYDEERTAWNRGETRLSKANVGKLRVQWKAQLATPARDVVLSTLTAPIVVAGVVTAQGPRDMLFLLGADDVLYALDANTGAKLWEKRFPNPVKPARPATWLCSNTNNATPTADKARGIIYFIASDGLLRGLSLADGSERLTPVEMVAPYTRAWSLNLIGDVVYTTSGRACGQLMDPKSPMYLARDLDEVYNPDLPPTDPSAVTAVDVGDLGKPTLTRFYTSGSRPAAPWGRGGLIKGPNNSVLLETSDGLYDPQSGYWGDSLLRLSAKAARLVDSFTPSNAKYILQHDLAGSASPTIFPFGDKTLVAYVQKESVLRLLDAKNLGGRAAAQHQQPLWQSTLLGNDRAVGTDPSQGVWGAITTYLAPNGKRYLYLPMWGPISVKAPTFPVSGGDAPNGMIMAFEVVDKGGTISAEPRWTSTDMIMADPPTVANGVLYATSTGGQPMQNPKLPDGTKLSSATAESAKRRSTPTGNLTLFAYDAESGKQLYSSKKLITDWVHFNQPVVALGKVFIVTHDAQVFAFGVGK